MDEHRDLFQRLMPGLGLEINNALGSRDGDAIRYAVNSVDWLRVDGGEVRFGGVAFDVRRIASP